jgi:probable F420-dependent oxidoreductase
MNRELPLLGFGLPVSGCWATPRTLLHLARRAEDLGYASLWTFQRMLRPTSGSPDVPLRERENPGARPADDPSYHAVLDPLAPLAFVAGHTRRIRLGVATVCAPFFAPALLAKALSTLDVLSEGRLIVGLGTGWLVEEYAAAGVPFERRPQRMEEYLACLQALWTQDPVEFAGEFYRVPRSHSGLWPVQRPHPPLLLGGVAPQALRRAGRLTQGWIASTRQELGDLRSSVDLVREGARQAGRDPEAVRIVVRGVVDLVDEEPAAPRGMLQGTRAQVREDLAELCRQGATEVFFDLNFSPRVVSPRVDARAAVEYAEQVLDALAPATLALA